MWGNPTKKDEETLKAFVTRFNVDYILNDMSIDDYIIGKQSKTSFCYIIERELDYVGGIRGATSLKFGVYYGIIKSNPTKDYRYTLKFGKNKDEAFNNVKLELASLIKRTLELETFKEIDSKISGMFKHKIMFCYNPKLLLPVYSTDDLKHFTNRLNLIDKDSFEELQLQLMEYRNNNYSNMDNLHFAYWLYDEFEKHITKEEIEKNNDLDNKLNEKIKKSHQEVNLEYETHPVDKLTPKIDKNKMLKYYPRNPLMAQIALHNANCLCEYDTSHYCFVRRRDNTRYTEVHHLIPLCFYDEFDKSLDVPENIVSLCSNCHNEIHYGKDSEKLIIKLYNERKELLKKAGIEISLEDLLEKYKQINSKE